VLQYEIAAKFLALLHLKFEKVVLNLECLDDETNLALELIIFLATIVPSTKN
jgi:hypothetical protein